MKKSAKRVVGWGTGVSLGVIFVLLTFVLITGVNSGSMMSLNGQQISFNDTADDMDNIAPAAGADAPDEAEKGCGAHYDWIGQKANTSMLKKSGKPFRVLPPNSMMTMDHNPERINIHVDENGIIEDVKCG